MVISVVQDILYGITALSIVLALWQLPMRCGRPWRRQSRSLPATAGEVTVLPSAAREAAPWYPGR